MTGCESPRNRGVMTDQPTFTIRPETALDGPAIEALLDAAFGADRHEKRSYDFRDGVPCLPNLCQVAVASDDAGGERLIGTIRYWPISIGLNDHPGLLLGPLGVDPAYKGAGIGSALVEHSLSEALRLGHRQVILVGDPDYYRRFGFEPAGPYGIYMPGEVNWRVQTRSLAPFGYDEVEGPVRKADPAQIQDQMTLPDQTGIIVPFRRPA